MNIWIEAKGRRAKREREIFITQRTGGRSVLLLFAHDRRVDLASRTDGEIVGNTRIRLRSSNLWGIKAAAFIVVDAISYVGSTDEKDEPTSIWIFLFSQRDQTINQTIDVFVRPGCHETCRTPPSRNTRRWLKRMCVECAFRRIAAPSARRRNVNEILGRGDSGVGGTKRIPRSQYNSSFISNLNGWGG